MEVLKWMSWATTCSVFAALISFVWQAFLSLQQLNKVTTISIALLSIESGFKRSEDAPRPRVAIGYGACTDLLVGATDFLNYSAAQVPAIGPEFTVDEIHDEAELLRTFAYYFQNGAAAERIMPNETLFRELLATAKSRHRDQIKWFVGGNAPLMGMRFHIEGADVLLGARMSHKLRRLLPTDIRIAGAPVAEDDIHIILEYKAGDTWGPFQAPRANRYIVHSDRNNPHLNSLEDFVAAARDFRPRLLVVSGLQMMDSFRFAKGVREERLARVQEQLAAAPAYTLQHFEMASYVEMELLLQLRRRVLPYVDSLGMNEQELTNLRQVIEFGRVTLASDWNPRVAGTLDQMRRVFQLLAQDYRQRTAKGASGQRLLTRIHVHTLAFQALLVVRNSSWQNTKIAAAKAALTAHRYVCQIEMVNPEAASLILDESFATSASAATAQRMTFEPQQPVPCWHESIAVLPDDAVEVEICVAPVLVCRVAKKTAGAGDNISAAALSQQL